MTAANTVSLWEGLSTAAPATQGAVVLVAQGVVPDLASACDLPLSMAAGAALTELRRRTGKHLEAVLPCPACDDVMEVPVSLEVLAGEPPPPEFVEVGGAIVHSPTTNDLLLALNSDDPARELRERCTSWPPGAEQAGDATDVSGAAERLLGAAGLVARVTCPTCGVETSADLDVVGLLVDRVDAQARAVLAEVAELAGAFGWSEIDILALPEGRRQAYLALTRGA